MFSGVIGHERVQKILNRMRENDAVPHAFLFVGPNGTGRTTVAKKLFAALLNHTGNLNAHPDFIELKRRVDEKTDKRKSTISVEQIRGLNKRIAMSSMAGGWKVAFIEEAERLSIGAANALLKTLEEPKGKTLLMLCAGDEEQLPATVVSRCQVLRFYPVASEVIVEGLKKKGYGQKDAELGASMSQGCPGRAIKFLIDSEFRAELETGIALANRFLDGSLAERLGSVTSLIQKTEPNKNERLLEIVNHIELVARERLLERIEHAQSHEDLVSLLHRTHAVRRAAKHFVNPHLAIEHLAI